jgi:hypothetical protein
MHATQWHGQSENVPEELNLKYLHACLLQAERQKEGQELE